MSHELSLIEIDEQQVELLPTRTLMSMITQAPPGGGRNLGGKALLFVNLITNEAASLLTSN